MARKKFPGAKNSLDALCQRFNIDLSAREKHGALLDCELLADVYAEMIGAGANQRNLLFAQEKTSEQKVATAIKIVRETIYEARSFGISAEEEQAHEAFISKLKEPIWKKAN
jgi:DNA polymerase-3 subunit epsilon